MTVYLYVDRIIVDIKFKNLLKMSTIGLSQTDTPLKTLASEIGNLELQTPIKVNVEECENDHQTIFISIKKTEQKQQINITEEEEKNHLYHHSWIAKTKKKAWYHYSFIIINFLRCDAEVRIG